MSSADSENQILDLLQYVPDSDFDNRGLSVSYADYQAMYAMLGLDTSELTAEELRSNFPVTVIYYRDFEFSKAGDVILFNADAPVSYFDIQQGLSFGIPPSEGGVWVGDFDDWDAFFNDDEEYESTNRNNGTLYSAEDGSRMNLDDRDPLRPFGGELGQREPVFIRNDTLITTYAIEGIDEVLTDQNKLHDNEDVQRITNAAYDAGLPVSMFMFDAVINMGGSDEDYLDVPDYNWGAIINMWQDDVQTTDILFIYETEEEATEANEFWNTYDDVISNDRIDAVGGTFDSITTDSNLVRIRFTSAVPTLGDDFQPAGAVFLNFYTMILREDPMFMVNGN